MTALPEGFVPHIADHPSRAFKTVATCFLSETKNTHVDLAQGECLWTLSEARGLEEAGYCGKQSVLILTEDFGSWPIFAFKVRIAHVDKWRAISKDAADRMLARCIRGLEAYRPTQQEPRG